MSKRTIYNSVSIIRHKKISKVKLADTKSAS
jgi:hypothetical protein